MNYSPRKRVPVQCDDRALVCAGLFALAALVIALGGGAPGLLLLVPAMPLAGRAVKSAAPVVCGMTLCLLAAAQPRAETQRVEGLEFSLVEVRGDVEVEVSQGETAELLLRGDGEVLAKQPFHVVGETLVLGASKEYPQESFDDVKFKLSTPRLRQLRLRGGGDVYLQPVQLDELHLVLDGSGDVKAFAIKAREITLLANGSGDLQVASLETRDLKLVMSGSGDIQLGHVAGEVVEVALKGSGDVSVQEPGSAERIEINIAGSGDVDLSTLAAPAAEVNIVGSGTGRLGEVEALEVHILGSGDVHYRGEPRLQQSVFGSGELHRVR